MPDCRFGWDAGNGSQWSKMAQPLLQSSVVFRNAVRKCADALRPHNIDLLAEFGKDKGWKHPALAMVGLVAVQVRIALNVQLQLRPNRSFLLLLLVCMHASRCP
jgi:hypothetical protein